MAWTWLFSAMDWLNEGKGDYLEIKTRVPESILKYFNIKEYFKIVYNIELQFYPICNFHPRYLLT